jgi:hypothetical protein
MKKLTASLFALPLLLSGTAFADDHKDMHDDPAAWHQDMCTDHYAHAFGKIAYLQAKLGITDKQQAAWDAWQKVELDSAAKERDACLKDTPKGEHAPSILDQESRIETMLQDKLDELHASRAPLEALYAQLDDKQKDEFNHFGEWHHSPKGEMDGHMMKHDEAGEEH